MRLADSARAREAAARLNVRRAEQKRLLRFVDDIVERHGRDITAGLRTLADTAMVSKPTAAKYLALAVDAGFLDNVQDGKAALDAADRRTARYVRSFRWTGFQKPGPTTERNVRFSGLHPHGEFEALAGLTFDYHALDETRPIPAWAA